MDEHDSVRDDLCWFSCLNWWFCHVLHSYLKFQRVQYQKIPKDVLFDSPKIQLNPQNWWVSNQGEAEFPRTPLCHARWPLPESYFGSLSRRQLSWLVVWKSWGRFLGECWKRNDAIALVFQSTLNIFKLCVWYMSMIYNYMCFYIPKVSG